MSAERSLHSSRCSDGVHYFYEKAVCDCAVQASGPERAAAREGMVTVYDSWGRYLGCMGEVTWQDLLRVGEGEAPYSQIRTEREAFHARIKW